MTARLVAAIVVVAGCGGAATRTASTAPASAEAPPPPVGHETAACRNDAANDAGPTPGTAQPLDPGTVEGCFAVNDLGDAFAVTAPSSRGGILYRIALTVAPGAIGCIRFFDARGEEVPRLSAGGFCGASPGAALSGWIVVAGGTRAFFRLHDRNGEADLRARPYSVALTAEPIADDDEPNESPGHATPLALEAAHRAYLVSALNAPDLETDVYRVEASRAGGLRVEVGDAPRDLIFALDVLASDGRALLSGAHAPDRGTTLEVEQHVEAPGVYYLRLGNVAHEGTPSVGGGPARENATRPYTITASLR